MNNEKEIIFRKLLRDAVYKFDFDEVLRYKCWRDQLEYNDEEKKKWKEHIHKCENTFINRVLDDNWDIKEYYDGLICWKYDCDIDNCLDQCVEITMMPIDVVIVQSDVDEENKNKDE